MITRKSVLVVDNDQNFRRILDVALVKYGFEVDIASNAADALKLLIQKTFHIVLLDLHLPDMDGIVALGRLKSAAPWTPFIAMSAYETPKIEESVWGAGGLETLYKPFDLDSLVSLIRTAISGNAKGHAYTPNTSFQTIVPDQKIMIGSFKSSPEVMVSAKIFATAPESFQVALEKSFPIQGKTVDIRMLGDDALYEFSSSVLHITDDGLSWTIRKPTVIKRRQRRRHPRMAIAYPVNLQIPGELNSKVEISGMGRDISLGGVAIHSMSPIPKGIHVDIRWGDERSNLDNTFTISGNVVRVTDISHTEKLPIYQIAIEFDKLDPMLNHQLGRLIQSIRLLKPYQIYTE